MLPKIGRANARPVQPVSAVEPLSGVKVTAEGQSAAWVAAGDRASTAATSNGTSDDGRMGILQLRSVIFEGTMFHREVAELA